MKKTDTSYISEHALIKQPDDFEIGENSSVAEFTTISSKTKIGNNCCIDRNITIAGSKYNFSIGDFSAIAAGARIWLQSNNYVTDMISHGSSIEGDVTMAEFTGIGSNTVVMPNNHIPTGTVIGAMSFVPPNFKFKEWTVYAGTPIREIKSRDKEQVLAQYEKIKNGG